MYFNTFLSFQSSVVKTVLTEQEKGGRVIGAICAGRLILYLLFCPFYNWNLDNYIVMVNGSSVCGGEM